MSRIGTTEWLMEVNKGNIPGHRSVFILGYTNNLTDTETTTLWDVGGLYEHLNPAGETLYISSSSASDTTSTVTVIGLDANHDEIVGTATLNGQNQVEVVNIVGGGAITFRYVHLATIPDSGSAAGDVYVAVSTALTLGVPTDLAKAKAKIPISQFANDVGTRVASHNISHNGFYAVPAGHCLVPVIISGQTTKDKATFLSGSVTAENGSTIQRNPLPVYQDRFGADFRTALPLGAGSLLEFVGHAETGSGGAFATITVTAVLIEDAYVNTANVTMNMM